MPTPLGVPVRIRSPGDSVLVCEMKSTSSWQPKIRSEVRLSWRSSPLTQVWSRRSARVRGPRQPGRHPQAERGKNVSALASLARVHWGSADWRSRGHVVGDAVAADPAAGADHDRQLALVIEALDDLWATDPKGRQGGASRAAHLDEHDRTLGSLVAGLLHVLGVVKAIARRQFARLQAPAAATPPRTAPTIPPFPTAPRRPRGHRSRHGARREQRPDRRPPGRAVPCPVL